MSVNKFFEKFGTWNQTIFPTFGPNTSPKVLSLNAILEKAPDNSNRKFISKID